MNKDYTHISVVQDKSGSMATVWDETIKGFNGFLDEQKKTPGKCTFSLMQFDTEFNMLYDTEDIHNIKSLTHQTYMPNGYTALLDAIGRTIITTGQKLENLKEEDRPARVIVAILTDGEENSSKEYAGEMGRSKIFEMIKHQTDTYKWQFVFLGANQDAIQSGANIGVASVNAISTSNTGRGVTAAYAALSSNTRRYRGSDPADTTKMHFSAAQRQEQYAAGAVHDSMAGQPDAPGKPSPAKTTK
jgi:hypothetical protein